MRQYYEVLIVYILFFLNGVNLIGQNVNVAQFEKQAERFYFEQEYELAKPIYLKLSSLDTVNYVYPFRLAFCLKETEEYELATELYFELIKKNYRPEDCYINLSTIAVMQSKYYIAKEYLFEGRKKFPDNKEILEALLDVELLIKLFENEDI